MSVSSMNGLLQSQADFVSALDALAPSPLLALDTEFMRERSYRPQLCLVQLGDAVQQVCVDPLQIDDLAPLAAQLADARQIKLVHAAAQDLEVLHQRLGILPAPLFDTQLAATLCGVGEQIGYAALIERLLGVVLDKSSSRTDWAQRPLTPEQYRYALDDVRYLPEAYALLDEQLNALGRADWMREDCAAQLDPARWTVDPLEAWRRVKGWQRVPKSGFARLRQLAAWREQRAQALDRPRRWILDDESLLRMVNRPPRTLKALQHGETLPAQLFPEAEAIMDALALAEHDPSPVPPAWKALQGDERERFARMVEVLEQRAQALNLPASVLLNRADIERLARQSQALEGLAGWRAEVLGESLAAVL
ncbi:MAG: ribonuclease D [Gammaproteobacteria bacterium 28-57-27]|nr:MAG: ribonuclease D [Gammaproteobacteria bacterium 28-57-27]